MASCTCANPTSVSNAVKQGTESIATATKDSATKINETLYGKAVQGVDGAIGPLRYCHWQASQVTATGSTLWYNIQNAAMIAVALANSLAQQEIASKQMDLAEGYYDMDKFKWDRFQAQYIPLEKKLLREVSSEPVKQLNCADDRRRAQNAVSSAYSVLDKYLTRQAKKLRLCVDDAAYGMLNHRRALALVDTENYNLQDDQWFVDFKNDQRWNRRSTVLNLGRNLSSEALRYGEVARATYQQVGSQIETAAQGLMNAFGYYGSRNPTYYPTTYLSGGSNSTLIQVPTQVYAPSGGQAGRGGGAMVSAYNNSGFGE